MKTPSFLLIMALAAGCLNLGAASSPYTLEAPPGQYTNAPSGLMAGKDIALEINPDATAALIAWDRAADETKPAAPAPLPPPTVDAPAALHGLYSDLFLSMATPDFSHQNDFGYGLGVGYAFNPTLSASLRVTHAGLNIENNAVSTVGLRLESRLPWSLLSPYAYVGSSFDLRSDQFHLLPGIGIELGVTKLMKGMSLFGEVGLDANLRGSSSYLAAAGVRVRF